MNLTLIHDSIINRAADRSPMPGLESHHIIPRCEGGLSEGAQVLLTQKEHRLIHKLRYKINGVLGNLLAYNLMKYGRAALQKNHKLWSKKSGHGHHRVFKERDPAAYSERQRKSARIAGALSRDKKLGFHALSPEQLELARNRGRCTTVSNQLGMFDPAYRNIHAKSLHKQIITPAGMFESMHAAAAHYNVCAGTITYRVTSQAPQWSEWAFIMENKND